MAKDKATTLRMSTSLVADTKKLKRRTLAEFKELLGIVVSKPTIPYHRYERVQHKIDEEGITVERRDITILF